MEKHSHFQQSSSLRFSVREITLEASGYSATIIAFAVLFIGILSPLLAIIFKHG